MPTEDDKDLLNHANFGLLPEPKGRWGSFGVSMITNVVIMVLLLVFTAAVNKQVRTKIVQQITFLQPAPPPPPVKVPKVKVVAPPQKLLAKLEPPKIVMPKPEPKVEMPKPIKLNTPEQPKLPPAPPKAVAPPPQPKVGLFSSPHPTEVANNHERPTVKTGGYGDPSGVHPNPNANRQATIVASGDFNRAPGVGAGAGAARKGSVSGTSFGSGVAHGVPGGHDRGTVASAGFANGVIGGTGKPGGHGTVSSAGFSNNIGRGPTQVAVKQSTPSFVPPIVLSEPQPKYTAEAQQLKIQGEVTLQVRFLATGQVEVLRVVNGLGHGLDEQAKHVAEHIRFKPAERDGHPVDHTTLIHVTFQLA